MLHAVAVLLNKSNTRLVRVSDYHFLRHSVLERPRAQLQLFALCHTFAMRPFQGRIRSISRMGKNKVDSQKGPANMGDNTHRTRKHTKWKARLDLIEAIHSSEGSWRRNAAYVI